MDWNLPEAPPTLDDYTENFRVVTSRVVDRFETMVYEKTFKGWNIAPSDESVSYTWEAALTNHAQHWEACDKFEKRKFGKWGFKKGWKRR